ncbi:MAG: glycosyltransferase, partial [Chitinophagaceae bacterium]
MNKISICTVCMNRATHLYETLPVNISDNTGHPNIEFIILDYNSKDGLEDWAKENLQEHIKSGLVKYYRTCEPEYFSMTHSKNMLVKLASGNINCIVDADNYAGPDYANWVDSVFGNTGNKIIITTLRAGSAPYKDQGGKICFLKDHFNSVRGFDEEFTSHGVDDVDIINRLEQAGGTRVFIEEQKYLKYIGHSDTERLKNYAMANKLVSVYLMESTIKNNTKVLYLLNDNSFFEV